MRNSNTFAFRPTVEQLTDRTMPSVTLISGDIVIPKSETAMSTRTAAIDDTVMVSLTVKPTASVLGRQAGGDQLSTVDLATESVFARKAGEGQKDW